ncbi:MAG: hypothetical protein JOZ90_06760 [Alphaproteobacteria bacterium]|nr:hypothetical protein [Alphaproteobacteria bacterium]MBV9371130.1 hypothetical protein [Alphaproteobacteria bacterium]MBV9900782.1 hypothetical protein [Alphaproteobacteria bacterium]
MFETLIDRAARLARAQAGRKAAAIARRAAGEAPRGVAVAASEGGVALSGRGLSLRSVRDAAFGAFLESLR